jgi:hypothetical protein
MSALSEGRHRCLTDQKINNCFARCNGLIKPDTLLAAVFYTGREMKAWCFPETLFRSLQGQIPHSKYLCVDISLIKN